MALAKSWSVALIGIEGHLIRVEADLAKGIPAMTITGLPDAALNEARDRIRAAVANSGGAWPTNKRITLGLSPASLPKRGSGFDLALAAAVLCASEVLPQAALEGTVLLGELGLDGSVRGVPGVLPALVSMQGRFPRAIVSADNLAEARLVPDMAVVGVRSLRDLVSLLRGQPYEVVEPEPAAEPTEPASRVDLADVAGQPVGRYACEVAAAGGHNLLLIGTQGSGKTMLAECFSALLPDLTVEESLEVTAIHSVAELLPAGALIRRPPFQSPHQGSSQVALIGGGSGIAKPGAVSLAHRGVLFLDEATEYSSATLDALRQPLESGSISIRRVNGTATYPARFALMLAANPCKCGQVERACTCPPHERRTYLRRLSGPLLDRIDITVAMSPVTRQEIQSDVARDSTAVVARRVAEARDRALERLRGTPWRTNAEVPPTVLVQRWPVPKAAMAEPGHAMDRGTLSARGYARIQRLAWTVCDLQGGIEPTAEHVNLALSLRFGAVRQERWAA